MTKDRNADAALDAALAQWGRHDAGDPDALARIIRHADAITATPPEPQLAKPASGKTAMTAGSAAGQAGGRRWLSFAMGGSAIAASIAIALMVSPRPDQPAGSFAGTGSEGSGFRGSGFGGSGPAMPGTAIEQGSYELAAADRAVDSFAMLFTLTAEEELYL